MNWSRDLRAFHRRKLVMSLFLNVGEECCDTFVAGEGRFLALEMAFHKHGLETAPLIVEDGSEQVPKSELRP